MKCKLCSLITDTFTLTLQCKTDRKCLKCIFVYEIFPHCIFWKVTCYNIGIVSKNLGGDHILFNIMFASLNMLWYNWKLYYFRLHVYLSFFNSSSINNYHFDDFFVGAAIYWNVFNEEGKRSWSGAEWRWKKGPGNVFSNVRLPNSIDFLNGCIAS